MARGTTLQNLLVMMQDELIINSSPSVGASYKPAMKRLIQRVQRRLYDDHDWSFLQEDHSKILAAGQRYYDFPTTIDMESVLTMFYKWGGEWIELDRGISLPHYNAYDSDADARSDPAMRWDVHGEHQFEIWPVPASNGIEVRFTGVKKLPALVNDNDRAVLDDDLIVLFAAAEEEGTRQDQDCPRHKPSPASAWKAFHPQICFPDRSNLQSKGPRDPRGLHQVRDGAVFCHRRFPRRTGLP